VIVIDEIDRLVDFEKSSDFIYCFADIYNEFEGELFTGICPIFISNKINLLKRLPIEITTRIPYKLHFKPYDLSQLFQILKVSASYALKDDMYDDKIIEQVAREINDGTKSAREAKLLLHYTILEKNSEKAREKTDMDLISEELKTYSYHQKLALWAVLKKHKQIEKMSKSPNKRLYYNTLPTTNSIWEIYKNICEQRGETSKGFRQFHRLLEPMIRNAILKTERKRHPSTRGMANLIYLNEEQSIMFSIIQEGIGEV
jgi:Cdc6-like AAA superfamily ATPase